MTLPKSSSQGPRTIDERVDFLVPPTQFKRTSIGQTTIDAQGVYIIKCANTGAVTISNIINGNPNGTIKLLGDGQTSLANNSVIKTSTGALKLLAANLMYTLTLVDGIWYEDA